MTHPLCKLIGDFENRTTLPVEPAEVQKWLIDHGFVDEFLIHYVECDPDLFAGMYVERQGQERTYTPGMYGEPVRVREIFINANLDEQQRRVAEVKETLHVLDLVSQKSSTIESVDTMISVAATFQIPHNDRGLEALTDVMAVVQALAVLFPWAAREILKPKVDAGQISCEAIAKRAHLPEAYVEYIFGDEYAQQYHEVNFGLPGFMAGTEGESLREQNTASNDDVAAAEAVVARDAAE